VAVVEIEFLNYLKSDSNRRTAVCVWSMGKEFTVAEFEGRRERK
jgi:hypothetical protein